MSPYCVIKSLGVETRLRSRGGRKHPLLPVLPHTGEQFWWDRSKPRTLGFPLVVKLASAGAGHVSGLQETVQLEPHLQAPRL